MPAYCPRKAAKVIVGQRFGRRDLEVRNIQREQIEELSQKSANVPKAEVEPVIVEDRKVPED